MTSETVHNSAHLANLYILRFSSMCFLFQCYGTNCSSSHCPPPIYTFLCLDCALLCPLDTLLLKLSCYILFEAFPDFCSELTISSFIFLLNILAVCDCKLHVLCYNNLYPFLNGPCCILLFFTALVHGTVHGPWEVLSKWWTESKWSE